MYLNISLFSIFVKSNIISGIYGSRLAYSKDLKFNIFGSFIFLKYPPLKYETIIPYYTNFLTASINSLFSSSKSILIYL